MGEAWQADIFGGVSFGYCGGYFRADYGKRVNFPARNNPNDDK